MIHTVEGRDLQSLFKLCHWDHRDVTTAVGNCPPADSEKSVCPDNFVVSTERYWLTVPVQLYVGPCIV